VNFAFNEDQDRLRDSAARFLRDRIDLGRLTAQGNRPDTTYDQTLWNEIVALGWTGLIVPEEYGGLGMSLVDWVVITEELGRSLAPCPYLGNYAGTLALLRAGSAEQKETLLPQIIGGTVQTALAWSESEQTEDPLAVTATVRNGRLTGSKRYVFDADTATHLIVTARDASGSLGFYLVERDHGVSIEPCHGWMSRRRVCRVTFAEALPNRCRLPSTQRGRGSRIACCSRCRRRTPAAPNRSCGRPSRTRISASSSASRSRRIRRSSTSAPT
jgi:acyl-CoA dehydrogenase